MVTHIQLVSIPIGHACLSVIHSLAYTIWHSFDVSCHSCVISTLISSTLSQIYKCSFDRKPFSTSLPPTFPPNVLYWSPSPIIITIMSLRKKKNTLVFAFSAWRSLEYSKSIQRIAIMGKKQ